MTRPRTVHVNSKQNQSPGVLAETTQSPQLVDSGHFHLQNGLFITENWFFTLCASCIFIFSSTHMPCIVIYHQVCLTLLSTCQYLACRHTDCANC